MKSLNLISGCIAIVFLIAMHPGHAQQHLNDTMKFENEPKINLTKFIRTYGEVKPEKENFKRSFTLGIKSQFKKTTDSISASALVTQLYDQAKTRMLADPSCRDKKCITGVKIYYGLRGDDIRFYYQPLYMVQLQTYKDSFAIVNYNDGNFYTFDQNQGKFVQNTSAAVKDTTEYQGQMMVKRRPTNPGFEKRDQFDADAIIFSFQEILRFYHMVNPDETTSGRYYTTHLLVHSASAEYPHPLRNSPGMSAKHTLFMTHFKWSKHIEKGDLSFKILGPGPGANLAHLCPPSCTIVDYPTDPE